MAAVTTQAIGGSPHLPYAVEPIVALYPHTRWEAGALAPMDVLGVELLYRGAGPPPDAGLLGWLATEPPRPPQHPVHVNVDTDGILALPDPIVAAAARARPLVIEWTEKPIHGIDPASAVAHAGDRLGQWRQQYGLQIAIDDLGTGLDGMARAASIPDGPDILKLAGRLFQRARDNRHTRAVIANVIADLPPTVQPVLEWLETPADMELARRLAGPFFQHAESVGIQGWITDGLNQESPA
jgi:hypothetical protein